MIIFSAAWQAHYRDPQILSKAIEELLTDSPKLILLTNPPVLPFGASREGIRKFSLHPFFEAPETKKLRRRANLWLKAHESQRVVLIDIEGMCTNGDGSLRFLADNGEELYRDATHLDVYGAQQVSETLLLPAVKSAISVQARH